GLYRGKARNIIQTCRILVEQHGSRVPESREALEALPGVGRKTANVVLNTAFGHATIAVDTHIFRVANRTGIAPGKDVREVAVPRPVRVPAEDARAAREKLMFNPSRDQVRQFFFDAWRKHRDKQPL